MRKESGEVNVNISKTRSKWTFWLVWGRFVPETLMPAVLELEQAYEAAIDDPIFQEQLSYYLSQYVGRETPLYFAERLTKMLGGAKIYLKREDLNHTGHIRLIMHSGKHC